MWDFPALREKVERLRTERNVDELALLATRLAGHLELALQRIERDKDLAAAVEYKAASGTLDELLTAALAKHRAERDG